MSGSGFPAAPQTHLQGPTPRVIYVSRHNPASESGLRPSSSGMLGNQMPSLYSPRQLHGAMLPATPNSDRLSMAPTVVGAPKRPMQRSTQIPQLPAASRPFTAEANGGISSASLPTLLPQHQAGRTSPYAEDLRASRELSYLRKRNKELEGELKRAAAALTKYRANHQIQQMQAAYGFQHGEETSGRAPGNDVQLERVRRECQEELQRMRAKFDEKVQALSRQHATEVAGLVAQAHSLESSAGQTETRLKEERVELLRRQIARRMMNTGLARGWLAWVALWTAKVYALQRLREAANRIRRPELAHAFSFWVGAWEAAQRVKEEQAQQLREAGLRGERETIQEELARIRTALASAEEDKRSALERQRIELAGSAGEMATLQEQRAKEERVELLRRQIMRRMMNQGLTNGWQAWMELWSAKTYAMNRLREVGNKFRAPELSAAFAFWIRDWEEQKHAAQVAELERQSNTLEAQLRKARFDAGQLELVRTAHEDELAALKDTLNQLFEDSKERDRLAEMSSALQKENAELVALQHVLDSAAESAERKRLDAEHDAAKQHQEDKRLLEKLLSEQRRSFEEELQRFGLRVEADKEEKEKEERIELLRRQMLRRIMNRSLSSGWTSWYEFWSSRRHALDWLRRVGNRFRTPELSAAFVHLVRYADARRQAKRHAASAQKIALLGDQSERAVELETQLERALAEIDAMVADRQTLRERITALDGGVAEAERLRQEQLAAAKEERVELLRRQIGRRMMNQGIIRGWTAWNDFWSAKMYAMRRLREVGNKLRAPELANAFYFWIRDCDEIKRAKLESDALQKTILLADESERSSNLEAQLKQARMELDAMKADRQTLRERITALDGGVAEAERLRQEQLAAAKEERVELLRRQIGRRMMNQGIIRGWTAWNDFWSAKMYAMRRLREVGNKLRAPELANAFEFWFSYCEAKKQAKAMADLRRDAAGSHGARDALAVELESLRTEMSTKLAAAEEDKRVALERQLIELTGSSDAQAALRAQREKEERIDSFHRQFTRRMLNQNVSRAWSAWIEMWEARAYALTRLREVSNRLRAPALSSAFAFWVRDWEKRVRCTQQAALEQQQAKLEEERLHVSAELQRVRAEYEHRLALAEEQRIGLLEKVRLTAQMRTKQSTTISVLPFPFVPAPTHACYCYWVV